MAPFPTATTLQGGELPRAQQPCLWVVCFCAAWCGACEEYRAVFAHAVRLMGARFPQIGFVWIDVEDHADMMGDLDIENFPSMLIADHAGVRFLGPLTPQLGTLTRLVEAMQETSSATTPHLPETLTIVNRLALRSSAALEY